MTAAARPADRLALRQRMFLQSRGQRLVLAGHYESWAQFAPGSVHPFEPRRGGLEPYPLNMRPLGKALREYNAQRP